MIDIFLFHDILDMHFRFRLASMQLEALCSLKSDADIRDKLGQIPPKLEQLYFNI